MFCQQVAKLAGRKQIANAVVQGALAKALAIIVEFEMDAVAWIENRLT